MKALVTLLLASALLLGCLGSSAQPTASPTVAATAVPTASPTIAGSPQPTAVSTPTPQPTGTISNSGEARVVELVGTTNGATRWEWQPSTIEAKKGERLKLRVTVPAGDVDHGISIPEFGVKINAPAGQAVEAEFVADKAGTFPFFCSAFCGAGHREMKGQLVVTE